MLETETYDFYGFSNEVGEIEKEFGSLEDAESCPQLRRLG